MKKLFFFVLPLIFLSNFVLAQTPTSKQPSTQQQIQPSNNVFDLSQYGVSFQPDARLIIVMAALEAAGFEFQSAQDSPFRQTIRRDLQNLDPELKRRLSDFFVRNNKNYVNASPTEQIARYVSLAYVIGPAPEFVPPARSTDLPAGLLEVLDFAPLMTEFYQKSGIAQKLPEYIKEYQAYSDKLRPSVNRVVRETTTYLNTRPQLSFLERITVPPDQTQNTKKDKKPAPQKIQTRERMRQFFVVPDLLAVPNTVKFRNIGDDYYAIIGFFDLESAQRKPEQSSELRRAYLQFLIDPLVYKNAKEISAQREAIRSLLDERAQAGVTVSPDVYLATARSLVIAADVRERKVKRIEQATQTARAKMANNKQTSGTNTSGKIVQITDEVSIENNRLTFPKAEAEAFAELSEAYENGAVLAFFFNDQLSGLESAGFDISSSLAEMLASFDVVKEKARLKETETARRQAVASLAEQRKNSASRLSETETRIDPRRAALTSNLNEIAGLLKKSDYETAEKRLLTLLSEFPGDARIFFALGQTASFSAQKVFDENLRDERLKKAVVHYRNAIAAADPEADKSLLLQTHVALGKIYEFYDENEAALKEFEAAVAIGKVEAGAYEQALAGKERLGKK